MICQIRCSQLAKGSSRRRDDEEESFAGSISGDNFDVSFIPHDLLRPLQSTLPSGPWLFPAPDIWGDQVRASLSSCGRADRLSSHTCYSVF